MSQDEDEDEDEDGDESETEGAAAEAVYAMIRGTDVGGRVYEGMPCIFCKLPVEPGKGAQAVPPIPAMHTVCMMDASRKLGYTP